MKQEDIHRLIISFCIEIYLRAGQLEGVPSLHSVCAAHINRLYRKMSYSVHFDQISYLAHALFLSGNCRRHSTRECQQYYRDHAYRDHSAACYASHFPEPSYTARNRASP